MLTGKPNSSRTSHGTSATYHLCHICRQYYEKKSKLKRHYENIRKHSLKSRLRVSRLRRWLWPRFCRRSWSSRDLALLLWSSSVRSSMVIRKTRTSPPVVDVVRKASHHRSSYRIRSHRSLQLGPESALRFKKYPRGVKLAPSLPPPPWRARGHRRYTPPTTIPPQSTWICEERGETEVRARLPLPTLKRSWRQHPLREQSRVLRRYSLTPPMKPPWKLQLYRLDSFTSSVSSTV